MGNVTRSFTGRERGKSSSTTGETARAGGKFFAGPHSAHRRIERRRNPALVIIPMSATIRLGTSWIRRNAAMQRKR